MMSKWRIFCLALSLFLLGFLSFRRVPEPPHANCCLCMCHSRNEEACARLCIRLQHGKEIIYEPQMIVCTRECERHGVEKTQ
jgi:hypothetical protein